MIHILALTLLLPSAWPAAAAEWRDARWGMGVEELEALFGDDLQQITRRPLRYRLAGRRIRGVPFEVTLTLDGRPSVLQRIDLTSMALLENLREGAFRNLLRDLGERHGAPFKADVPQAIPKTDEPWYVNRSVTWRDGGSVVSLDHVFVSMFANSLTGSDLLIISYESPQPPVFTEPAKGWWPLDVLPW